MENAGYLFAAFAIVWAVTFLYILLLFNRQKSLRREIGSLKEGLTGKEGEYVSVKDTLEGCDKIISGRLDTMPEEKFYLIGKL